MSIKLVNSPNVPGGRAKISHAAVYQGIVYVSGMVGRDPATGRVVDGGIVAQSMQTLENLRSVLEAAKSSMRNVIKMNCFIQSMSDFDQFNSVWESHFEHYPPARTCVEATLGPGFLIEIEAIAAL